MAKSKKLWILRGVYPEPHHEILRFTQNDKGRTQTCPERSEGMTSESPRMIVVNTDLSQFDKYFFEYSVDCPYELPYKAVYRQAYVGELQLHCYEAFMLSSYRRMGKVIYCMVCPLCGECVPIRLEVDCITYNKTQKKIKNKNRDLQVRIGKPEFSEEKLSLYAKFLSYRYPKHSKPNRNDYETFFIQSFTDTLEFAYYLDEKLIGVGTVDKGKIMLNGVYFFFDPEIAKRSPGVYNLIYIIEYCKKERVPYFVMGFYIKEISAMAYKADFYPHELLVNGKWKKIEKKNAEAKNKTLCERQPALRQI